MHTAVRRLYLLIVYALLYIPMIVLVLYSTNSARFSLTWHGFSWQWYQKLLQDHDLWSSFSHSFALGVCASAIATTMGLFSCVYFFLNAKKNKELIYFNTMILLLIILPDLIFGVALLIFFNVMHIPLGFYSLLLAHITFCLPFVVLTIQSRIQTIDRNIYLSALDLGASRRHALHKILLPLLYPAILSAFLLSFTLSFDDVVISYFVSGPEFNILPLTIYSLIREGITPELNALCTVTLLITTMIIVAIHCMSRRPT